jgi:hypothetical protein
MAGAAPGWCPSTRLRGSGASVSARAGSGQERPGSDAARPLLVQGLQKMAVELSGHDILISYIISYDMYI